MPTAIVNKSNRIAYIDTTRVVAILSVVLLHCSTMFLDANHHDFVIGSILNSITRFGVPCFVMISGALFLDENRKITIKSILNKYVKGIIILIVSWNIIYAIAYTIILPYLRGGVQLIDYKIVVGKLIFSEGHMWFLYMILWLYLITPFLRKFVNKENRTLVKYFIVLGLVMCFARPIIMIIESFLPFNTSFLSLIDNFHADFVGGYTLYYITGWYLHNYQLTKSSTSTLYFFSFISIALVITLINIMPPSMVDIINCNENILIYIYSCGIYVMLKHAQFPRWVGKLAPYVFGIYIIHPILIFLFNTFASYANRAEVYLVKWIVVSVLACGIVIIFSKVKYLKTIVRT